MTDRGDTEGVRTATRIDRVAGTTAGVATVLVAVGVLWFVARTPTRGVVATSSIANVLFVVGMTVLAVTGALLLRSGRMPTMAWLLVGTGLAGVTARLLMVLALWALDSGHTSLAPWLGWSTNWSWLPGQALAMLLVLRFPEGRLLTRRWRYAERAVLGWLVATVLLTAFAPGPLGAQPLEPLDNPLGITALDGVLTAGLSVVFLAMPALLALAVVALLLRWSRASGAERRQLTTVAVALALLAVAAPFALVSGAGVVAEGLAWLVLPSAIAYAVARHDLWDLDLGRRFDRLRQVRVDERARLQRDLHDSLGPLLGSISMKVEASRNLIASGAPTPDVDRLLDAVGTDCETAVDEVRRLIEELGPSVLADTDLATALRQLTEHAPPEGPRVVVDVPDELPPLDPASEIAAYRVACEAVRNAVRHSGASTCRLVVGLHGTDLTLEVVDDGVGMRGRPAGVGRTSMAERVSALGGQLDVTEPAGGGVAVRARLSGALG